MRESGFAGCVAYDCFGAGQRVTQETFGGANWRRIPKITGQMFAVYFVVRQLHELLWYLTEALALPATRPLHAELRAAITETDDLARSGVEALSVLDPTIHRSSVNELLRRASTLARAVSRGPAVDRRGADLIGADLRAIDLRAADLRGASLIGANLRGSRLTLTDVTGADLRGADISGADLAGALFLTQSQVESARGDRTTTLPPALTRPVHWS
ncbi:MAG TPA: pentapeptide repeat-containing protein [Candidatus Limnocylindrales bacterium]